MFPFRPIDRPHHVLRVLALLAGVLGGTLRTKGADYSADQTLVGTMVNVGVHHLRPVSLAEIFSIVEIETGLKFSQPGAQLPMGEEVILEADGKISLASLFRMVSAQKDVEFERQGTQIVVKTKLANRDAPLRVESPMTAVAEPSVRPPLPGANSPVPAAPRARAAEAAARDVAATIGEIAGGSQSHARKEKQIAAAVRSAIAAATADLDTKADMLEAAVVVAGEAGGAASQFAETIANAAAFAPAMAGIKSGAARLRAAAYGSARSAKEKAGATVVGFVPVRSRSGLAEPAAVQPRPAASDGWVARPAEAAPATTSNSFFPSLATPPSGAPVAEPAPVALPSGLFPPNSPSTNDSAASASPASATTTSGPAESSASSTAPFGGAPAFNVAPLELPSSNSANPASGGTAAASADGIVQMEKFGVQGTVTRGSGRDLRMERTKSNVAIDFLSADQLAKFAAADLSEVVFRIPGVSVAGGQFAVVRGLSDRFLSTTLQGIKLPTPDPEKQAVQLDLIPSSAVEAVVVSKTYDSSLWAESSGGNMDVRTRAIPTEGLLRLSLGLKINSNATDGGPDYPVRGTTSERFGFGSRARIEAGVADPTWQYVPSYRSSFPAGNKLSMEYAHAFTFGEQRLGVLLNAFNEAAYKSKKGTRQVHQAASGRPAKAAVPATGGKPAVPADPGRPSDFEKGQPSIFFDARDYAQSESENGLGTTAAAGYRFSPHHEVKLTGIFVQTGNDLSLISGSTLVTDPVTKLPKPLTAGGTFSGAEDYAFYKGLEYFRERNLTVYQLAGRHTLDAIGGLKVAWSGQHGASYEKESPYSEAGFQTPLANFGKSYVALGGSDAPQALKIIWADNREKQKAVRLDFEWPFRLWGTQTSNLTFGAAAESTGRDTSGISIDYRLNSGGTVTADTPNGVFAKIVGKQGGIATPSTSASRGTRAYYTGANIVVLEPLRLVVGARHENFTLSTTGSGRWGGNLTSANFYGTNPAKGILGTTATDNPPFESREWYPYAGLIYAPWKNFTTRIHYSKTTGRPSLREVSPFFNKSIETDNLVIGNPALRPSDVTNHDLRFEWSPSRTDFLAVSGFRKTIDRPIEKRIFTQTNSAVGENTESWFNNPNQARVRGFEVEFRHGFQSWSETLRDFSLAGNYTRIDASVEESPQVLAELVGTYQDATKIKRVRRLFDQPESIANLDLTWSRATWGTSITLAVFAISDVLVSTAKPFYFDLYERANTRLDFLFSQQLASHLKLKLAVKNLADPARGLIYDRENTTSLVERNTYHAGRDFSATLTYDF